MWEYAKSIAELLEIDLPKQTLRCTHYFINKHKQEYADKMNVVRRPTDNMWFFAKEIAKALDLDVPNYTFDDVSNFIQTHKREFNHLVYSLDARIERAKASGELPDDVVEFLETNLYQVSGIYCFTDKDNNIMYIGKSVDLASRIQSSYHERVQQESPFNILYYPCWKGDISALEMVLIGENKPLLNGDGKYEEELRMFKSNIDVLNDFKTLYISNQK